MGGWRGCQRSTCRKPPSGKEILDIHFPDSMGETL